MRLCSGGTWLRCRQRGSGRRSAGRLPSRGLLVVPVLVGSRRARSLLALSRPLRPRSDGRTKPASAVGPCASSQNKATPAARSLLALSRSERPRSGPSTKLASALSPFFSSHPRAGPSNRAPATPDPCIPRNSRCLASGRAPCWSNHGSTSALHRSVTASAQGGPSKSAPKAYEDSSGFAPVSKRPSPFAAPSNHRLDPRARSASKPPSASPMSRRNPSESRPSVRAECLPGASRLSSTSARSPPERSRSTCVTSSSVTTSCADASSSSRHSSHPSSKSTGTARLAWRTSFEDSVAAPAA